MESTRQAKKLCKAIKKAQSAGIQSGDVCPRCGRPCMTGHGSDCLLNGLDIYVCGNCGIAVSLSELTGEDISIESWAVAGADGSEPASDLDNDKFVVLPKYRAGDRVIDTKIGWPCTVVHALPYGGVYEVLPDGLDRETVTLKDRELTLEMTTDIADYVKTVRAIFPIGARIRVDKVVTRPGDDHSGKSGVITEIADNGGVHVQFAPTDTIILYPDMDRFLLIGEDESDAEEPNQEDCGVTIEF